MDFDLRKNACQTKKHKYSSVSYFIFVYDYCNKVVAVTDCSNNS